MKAFLLVKTAKDIMAQIAAKKSFDAVRMRLESYAACLVRDSEEAKDIVSSAFSTLLQSTQIVEEKAFVPYLFRTVHNLCLNYRRNSARHRIAHARIQEREGKLFEYYSSLLESTNPSVLFTSEITSIYQNSLVKMSPEIRQTYQLRLDGLSYKEIARQMGISENRVDKNLRKVIAAMKSSLSDYL